MLQSILDLIKSNKFRVMFFSVLALVCAGAAKTMTWADVINAAWPIIVAYLGAQGLADIGKNKVIAEQRELRKRELEAKKA